MTEEGGDMEALPQDSAPEGMATFGIGWWCMGQLASSSELSIHNNTMLPLFQTINHPAFCMPSEQPAVGAQCCVELFPESVPQSV